MDYVELYMFTGGWEAASYLVEILLLQEQATLPRQSRQSRHEHQTIASSSRDVIPDTVH